MIIDARLSLNSVDEVSGEQMMLGHIGFSYIGFGFLLMLLIPNFIWAKKQPQGYTAENENKILLVLERIGEVLTSCCASVDD